MITILNVGIEITLKEAIELIEKLGLDTIGEDKRSAYTTRYRNKGISEFRVSMNLERSLKNLHETSCRINATVYALKFYDKNNILDIEKIENMLSEIIESAGFHYDKRKIMHYVFKISIDSDLSSKYFDLIKRTSKPKGKKEIIEISENNEQDKETYIKYKNDSRALMVDVSENGRIELTLTVSNPKINSIIKSDKYSLETKMLSEIDNNMLQEMELQLWHEYLNRLFGESDYYSIKEAEKILKANCKKIVARHNLISTLKGISLYKGEDEFLSHVNDEESKYDFMESFKSEKTAKKYIKELDSVYHINPITISRRDSAELKITKLPSLSSLVTSIRYKPPKRITAKDKMEEIKQFEEDKKDMDYEISPF